MNPYSHLVIASKLETLVNPEDTPEYYWGAIVPDIRYLAALQRQQTHIPLQRIVEFISRYPHLKSFLQGYLIHCLSDEVDLGQVFFRHFPFSMFQNKMSRQQIAVILELFYFENERLNKELSRSYNEVLNELGLTETLSTKLSQGISQYMRLPSPESRLLVLAQLLGLENDSRVDKYLAAARIFEKNWFLKNSLFFGIRTGKISQELVSRVAVLYQQYTV